MNATVMKRLASLELLVGEQTATGADPVDFSVFSDDELDLLEAFAERVHAWRGDNWFERVLSLDEQVVFERLALKAGLTD